MWIGFAAHKQNTCVQFMRVYKGAATTITIPSRYQANGRPNSAETNQSKYFCTKIHNRFLVLPSSVSCFFHHFLSYPMFRIPYRNSAMIPKIQYCSFIRTVNRLVFHPLVTSRCKRRKNQPTENWLPPHWLNRNDTEIFPCHNTVAAIWRSPSIFPNVLRVRRWIRGHFDVLQSHRFQLRARAANDQ